jgi:hypothetical protein
MNKKIKNKVIAFSMAVATLANFGALNANACSNDYGIEAAHKEAQEMEDLINYLDSFVTVEENEDNINVFALDLPDNIKSSVDSDLLNALITNMNAVNEKAISEDVVITDNGTVYDNTDEYILQGGNIDKQKDYWWGFKVWACRDCALDLIDDYNKIAQGAAAGATAGGLVCLSPAVFAGIGIILGAGYSAVKFSWCATDIGATLRKYPDSGVIVTQTLLTYSVDPQ